MQLNLIQWQISPMGKKKQCASDEVSPSTGNDIEVGFTDKGAETLKKVYQLCTQKQLSVYNPPFFKVAPWKRPTELYSHLTTVTQIRVTLFHVHRFSSKELFYFSST